MEPTKWIDLMLVVSTGFCSVLFIKNYLVNKSLLYLYFGIASLALCLPYGLDLFELQQQPLVFEWSKLIAIITYISGLLALIRESKPVFARFPVFLTALPFFSILFFPLMIETYIIKDLLNAIYQGGALLVTGLILFVNFRHSSKRIYHIAAVSAAILAYVLYWLYFNRTAENLIWISEILLAFALVLATFQLISSYTENKFTQSEL